MSSMNALGGQKPDSSNFSSDEGKGKQHRIELAPGKCYCLSARADSSIGSFISHSSLNLFASPTLQPCYYRPMFAPMFPNNAVVALRCLSESCPLIHSVHDTSVCEKELS